MVRRALVAAALMVVVLALGACAPKTVVAPDGQDAAAQAGQQDVAAGDDDATLIRDDVSSQDISRPGGQGADAEGGGFATLPLGASRELCLHTYPSMIVPSVRIGMKELSFFR